MALHDYVTKLSYCLLVYFQSYASNVVVRSLALVGDNYYLNIVKRQTGKQHKSLV